MYPFSVKIPQPAIASKLEQWGISPFVSGILAARGIHTVEEAQAILSPNETLSHDPYALDNMEKAVRRIQTAIAKKEAIAVYGDYDVDGITATALLTNFLQSQGANVLPYIPHRIAEGYGLNQVALEELFRRGIRLVLTVDCGISGKEQVDFANDLGMQVIITDHHSCPKVLPPAYAIVNPRMGNYPFPNLAGVGVALKIAQALCPVEQREEVFFQYSDLVAVGTIADVMPMEGENRYFVREGLKKLNQNPLLGLQLILEEIGVAERTVNTGTIGYNLAPRINAAGRLDCSEVALDLLLTTDQQQGKALVQELCQLNLQRQEIESDIFQECIDYLEENPPEHLIFLENDQWHVGVVGIVASRLGEHYQLPTVMVCTREGIGKGSCRTFGEINLYELLTNVSPLLLGFGGHAQAAGFTVAEEHITELAQALEAELKEQNHYQAPKLQSLDLRCAISQLTLEAVEELDSLEPTGANCPRPTFLLEQAEVIGASLVGGGRHLRLRLRQDETEISGIYFHYMGDPIYIGVLMDIAFHLQINEYRGEITPQLQIFSMCLSQEADSLYQRWKRGSPPTAEEASIICPSLGEVKSLYSMLQKSPVVQEGKSYSQLYQWIEQQGNLSPYHGESALALLRDCGLVELDSEKHQLSLSLKASKATVEEALEHSSLYRLLQQSATSEVKGGHSE